MHSDTLIDIDRRYRVPIYVLENGTAADDKLDANGDVVDGPASIICGPIPPRCSRAIRSVLLTAEPSYC